MQELKTLQTSSGRKHMFRGKLQIQYRDIQAKYRATGAKRNEKKAWVEDAELMALIGKNPGAGTPVGGSITPVVVENSVNL